MCFVSSAKLMPENLIFNAASGISGLLGFNFYFVFKINFVYESSSIQNSQFYLKHASVILLVIKKKRIVHNIKLISETAEI